MHINLNLIQHSKKSDQCNKLCLVISFSYKNTKIRNLFAVWLWGLWIAAAKAYANRRSFMVMNEVSIFNIFQHIFFFFGQRIYFDKINLRVLFERSEFFGRVGNIFPNSNHKHMHTTIHTSSTTHICDQKRFYKLISNSIWNIILIILPRLSFQFCVCARWCWVFFYTLSSHFFPFPPIQNNNNNKHQQSKNTPP